MSVQAHQYVSKVSWVIDSFPSRWAVNASIRLFTISQTEPRFNELTVNKEELHGIGARKPLKTDKNGSFLEEIKERVAAAERKGREFAGRLIF